MSGLPFPDKCVLINLRKRRDRLEESLRLLSAQPWLPPVEVMPAIASPCGWRGCLQSHLQIYRRNIDHRHLLVFEDDILPTPHLAHQLVRCLEELPADYDILFLGYQLPNAPTRYSRHLLKPRLVWRTHAYMVSRRGMVKLLRADMSRTGISHGIGALSAAGRLACYCCHPRLAGTRPGAGSDIRPRSI